jgi:hypothetical protein
MAEKVKTIKNFRDSILLSSSIGRSFAEFCCEVSPPMADFTSNHETLRAILGWSLLPLVAMSWTALQIGPVATLVLIVLFTTLLVIGCAMLFGQKNHGMLE